MVKLTTVITKLTIFAMENATETVEVTEVKPFVKLISLFLQMLHKL